MVLVPTQQKPMKKPGILSRAPRTVCSPAIPLKFNNKKQGKFRKEPDSIPGFFNRVSGAVGHFFGTFLVGTRKVLAIATLVAAKCFVLS